jgi:hypothetical protein
VRAENGDASQRKAMIEELARFIHEHARDGVFVADRMPAAKQAARYGLPKE